ncbi:MAG: hypothetical protein DSY50_05080, partial [Desulfobulbus sp.]
GLIVQANEKAEELTGYKKSELIGLHQRVLSSSGEEGGRCWRSSPSSGQSLRFRC